MVRDDNLLEPTQMVGRVKVVPFIEGKVGVIHLNLIKVSDFIVICK